MGRVAAEDRPWGPSEGLDQASPDSARGEELGRRLRGTIGCFGVRNRRGGGPKTR